MALNQEKLVKMLVEEASALSERCPGYRKEIIETLCEIITLERTHRREGINIKQKIADQCNTLGRFVADNRRA